MITTELDTLRLVLRSKNETIRAMTDKEPSNAVL